MRTSTTAKFMALLLALLMIVPTGAVAASTETEAPVQVQKSTIEEVKELLSAESYYTYYEEKKANGWTDAKGNGVRIKAAEGYTFVPDPDFPDQVAKVENDPEKGEILVLPETGSVSWEIPIPERGFYIIKFVYRPVPGNESSTSYIQRELFINGKALFKESYYLSMTRRFVDDYADVKRDDGSQGFTLDKNKNEKKPQKKQEYVWSTYTVTDSTGYIIDPLKYALEAEIVKLTLNATMNELALAEIIIEPFTGYTAYDEYLARNGSKNASNSANSPVIQAETPTATSDLTIYALNDRTSAITQPQHASRQLLNTIGDTKWENVGQWIEWTIPGSEITESGYYYIVPRFKQSTRAGLYVSRRITINGEVPYDNCNYLQFNYSDDWQCSPLNDGTQNLKFYFEAGKDYTIRIEVGFGNMADVFRRTENCLTAMNEIYNSILKITGPNPDEYSYYGFAEVIYGTILQMKATRDELQSIVDEFKRILGGKSGSDIATLEKIIWILDKMCSKESEIAKNLDNLKVNSGTLGTWIMNTKLQVLTFDFISLQPADRDSKNYPRGRENFWNAFTFEIKAFIASFFTDYNSLGATDDNSTAEPVEVWISTSRDEAQVMRELIDNTCPVKVNLKLVAGGTLLPATLAGVGPDISLAMGQSEVINYAIRSAIEPLYIEADPENSFSDYPEICAERFSDQATVGLRLENPDAAGTYIYYGLPERMGFSMLFYRKDIFVQLGLEVPKTWDDLYTIVPTLQINYRKVGFPSSLGGLMLFMYQRDEDLYSNISGTVDANGSPVLDGMQINIDSFTSLQCFEDLCMLFQTYKFPRVYDLATYFRMGEMPIAISDYLTYNQFTIYATELKGLWEFTTLPGTIQRDEKGNIMYDEDGKIVVNNNAPCSVSAVVLLRDRKGRSKELAGNCWEFMKWWTSAESQSSYAKQYEALVGMAAKYNTANTEALKNMSWTNTERRNLLAQYENLKGTPEFPGGYIITRYVDFAFLNCYTNNADPTESLLDQIQYINNELSRKRKEFGLTTYEDFKKQNYDAHPEWFD